MKNERPTPFISITDFTSQKEAEEMIKYFLKAKLSRLPHMLGVGVMMSRKTLYNIPSSYDDVFPKKEIVHEIFRQHPWGCREKWFNVLHYADYSRNDLNPGESFKLALKYGGKNSDAIQLDMTWPPPAAIRQIPHHVKVILQVGKKAFKGIKQNPVTLLRRINQYREKTLGEYRSMIHYVLLDKSMGHGEPLCARTLLPFLRILIKERPDLGIVVAGGLGPETTNLAEPILQKFPFISFDAQSKLRPSGNNHDPINWEYAKLYLKEMLTLVNKYYHQ